MLNGLESGLQRRFERHGPYEMFQELKLILQANTQLRDMKSPTSSIAKRWRRNSSTSERVLRMSEYYSRLNQMGVNLPDKIVIDRIL